MMEIIDSFVKTCTSTLTSLGPISGVILIILESIIPPLPLSVFITLNMIAFGKVFGFLISWLSTIVGCMISFCLFRKLFRKKLEKFVKKKDLENVNNVMKSISEISLTNLVVFIAIPFSPAFLINIAAGLSKIKIEKFFVAIIIGKMMMVFFWGYIGTSLLESLTDITVLFKIGIMLVIAYCISKMVEKNMKIK